MKILKNINCSASIAHGILNLESGTMIDLNLIERTLAGIASREGSPDAVPARKALNSLRIAALEVNLESSARLVGDREVYIEAYAASDCGDGPSFASVQVNQEFLDNLVRLRKLCLNSNLTEVRTFASPDKWGPGEIETELRLQLPELVVTAQSFWFTDSPKNADYTIETRSQSIDEFLEKVLAQSDDKRLIFGKHQDYVQFLEDGNSDLLECDEDQVSAATGQDTPAA